MNDFLSKLNYDSLTFERCGPPVCCPLTEKSVNGTIIYSYVEMKLYYCNLTRFDQNINQILFHIHEIFHSIACVLLSECEIYE